MGLCSKVIFSVFIRRNSTFRVKYKRKCENNENSRCCCSKSRDVKEKRQKTCFFFGLSPFWQAKIKLIQPRTSTKSKTCSVAKIDFRYSMIFFSLCHLYQKSSATNLPKIKKTYGCVLKKYTIGAIFKVLLLNLYFELQINFSK